MKGCKFCEILDNQQILFNDFVAAATVASNNNTTLSGINYNYCNQHRYHYHQYLYGDGDNGSQNNRKNKNNITKTTISLAEDVNDTSTNLNINRKTINSSSSNNNNKFNKKSNIKKELDISSNNDNDDVDDIVRDLNQRLMLTTPNKKIGSTSLLSTDYDLFPEYTNEMFYAAHLLSRGYYQPAGPLITSHLLPPSPQPLPQQTQQLQHQQHSLIKSAGGSSILDSEFASQQLQQSISQQQQSASAATESTADSELLIAGDITTRPQTFRYAPQGHGPYSGPMHQIHCPTYPPTASYYAPYSQHPQDMCYSPPYQPYYPSKIYPGSYGRYVRTSAAYYPQTPSDIMYDHTPSPPQPPPLPLQSQNASAQQSQPSQQLALLQQPQPPTSSSALASSSASQLQQQIVPVGSSIGPPHLDHHYPTYFSTGYSPGGGQCYSRSIQPTYMDAPSYGNTCPCPMQSCPKNVHTGPLIGNSTKTSKGPVQSSQNFVAQSSLNNNNQSMAPMASSLSLSISSSTAKPTTISTNSKLTTCKTEIDTTSVLLPSSASSASTMKFSLTSSTSSPTIATNPSEIIIKPEQIDYLSSTQPIYSSYIKSTDYQNSIPPPLICNHNNANNGISSSNNNNTGSESHCMITSSVRPYYDKIRHAPPHHPTTTSTFTLNSKILEPPEMSISPARGSTGLPTLPPVQDSASQPVAANSGPEISSAAIDTPVIRKARLGKSMAREMMLMSQSTLTHVAGTVTESLPPSQISSINVSVAQQILQQQQPHQQHQYHTQYKKHYLRNQQQQQQTLHSIQSHINNPTNYNHHHFHHQLYHGDSGVVAVEGNVNDNNAELLLLQKPREVNVKMEVVNCTTSPVTTIAGASNNIVPAITSTITSTPEPTIVSALAPTNQFIIKKESMKKEEECDCDDDVVCIEKPESIKDDRDNDEYVDDDRITIDDNDDSIGDVDIKNRYDPDHERDSISNGSSCQMIIEDQTRNVVNINKTIPIRKNIHKRVKSIEYDDCEDDDDPEIIDVDATTSTTTISSIDLTSSIPTTTILPLIKKPKILELYKNTNGSLKISPSNSYKSLIKPSEPKPYLCSIEQMSPRKAFRFIRGGARFGVQQRKVLINGKPKKLLITSRRQIKRRVFKKKSTTSSTTINTVTFANQSGKCLLSSATETPSTDGTISPLSTTVSSPVSVPSATTSPTPPDTPTLPNSLNTVVEVLIKTENLAIPCDKVDLNMSALKNSFINNISSAASQKNVNDSFSQVKMSYEVLKITENQKSSIPAMMTSLDLTIDQVAKGYFSDHEILSKNTKQTNHLKIFEGRSKSESKTSAANKSQSHLVLETFEHQQSKNKNIKKRLKSPSKTRGRKAIKINTKVPVITTFNEIQIKNNREDKTNITIATMPTTKKQAVVKKSSQSSKLQQPQKSITTKKPKSKKLSSIQSILTSNNNTTTNILTKHKQNTSSIHENSSKNENIVLLDSGTTILDNREDNHHNQKHHHHNNNNNNIIVEDKHVQPYTNDYNSQTVIATKSNVGKKKKSGGAKFSNKKRHRVRNVPAEIEEVIAPRKSTAAPRWSNGWNWQGSSFQGKVFLNSDDSQVVRQRYASMIHDGGDIIRPGDCVLLRAGSKKNELPYVAKVASLWENPEDGEMMMSLLWYYRPEHTEQGRQPNDCFDEVFASKHQDHNSVACIEDKCYVLTFNEYCRYRKSIKALDEGIIEKTLSPFLTVPMREVPDNTNAEQVLFCRRVYEFRLKRLIKNPS